MPRVSVIMPSYNHEKYVADSVRSVLEQGFKDFELIIVDDASPDGTFEQLKRFDDPRIRLSVLERNSGGSVAANSCLAQVAGDYIAVLNSDDMYMPHKLERQVRYLDEYPGVAAVFSHVKLIGPEGEPISSEFYEGIFNRPGLDRFGFLNHFFYKSNCLCHPTLMIRKSVMDTLGPYDRRLAQLPDFELWVRLCLRHEIHVVEEPTVLYRVSGHETSGSAPSPLNVARNPWERALILRHYLEIRSFDELCAIFPLAERYREGHDARLIPFYIAMLALELKGSPGHRLFGLTVLYDMMADSELAGLIGDSAGFTFSDLIRMGGEADVFRTGEFTAARRMHEKVFENSQKLINEAQKKIAEKDALIADLQELLAQSSDTTELDLKLAEASMMRLAAKQRLTEAEALVRTLKAKLDAPSQAAPDKSSISIVMAVHDDVHLTERCLNAIAQNTTAKFEIVIVDDASTDLTAQYLNTLGGDVKVISNPVPVGIPASLNIAATVATGDVLVLLGNDVEPQAGWLEPLVEKLGDASVGIVTATVLSYPEGSVLQASPLACAALRKLEFYAIGLLEESSSDAALELCTRYRDAGLNIVSEQNSIVMQQSAYDDKAAVGKVWDARSAAQGMPGRLRWWESKAIINHINKNVCGSDASGFSQGVYELIKRDCAHAIPFKRAISVACGVGVKEMTMLAQGIVQQFELFEYSSQRIQKGLQRAKALGLESRLTYSSDDALEVIRDEGVYDLVYWNNALHHMMDVDEAVAWSLRVLKPGGVFVMDDFVGPTRMQWSDEELGICKDIMASLSDHYLRDPFNPALIRPRMVERQAPELMVRADPSECADSSRILQAVARHFPQARVIPTGGLVYAVVLNDILHNFNEDDPADMAELQRLLALDDECSARGISYYAVAIAAKSK